MNGLPPSHVGLVGFGSIGQSWARLVVTLGRDITIYDSSPLLPELIEQWSADLDVMGGGKVTVASSLTELAQTVEIVLESGPEQLDLKQEIFQELDAEAPAEVLLLSSTSALSPTQIQAACVKHPERVLVAHPFNPPHLMPLVEVVGGQATAPDAVESAMAVLRSWGKQPVLLRRELPGHIANRLQAALWREAYYLVAEGYISAEELDVAVAAGPGMRWALLGPFATQHLSGGPGGFRHLTEHLGPGMNTLWQQLGAPKLTDDFAERVITSVEEEFTGEDQEDLRRRRDAALVELMNLKQRANLQGAVGNVRTQKGVSR